MKHKEETEKRSHSLGGSTSIHSLSTSRKKNPSSFYKLMLPPVLQSKKLRIPEVFACTFGGQLSSTVSLTVPTGESWEVAVVREDNQLWFHDGWQEFVDYFSIGFSFFLMFIYDGDTNFQVRIFNLSACEILYPCNKACLNPRENKEPYCTNPSKSAPNNNHNNISEKFLPKKRALDDDAVTEVSDASNDSLTDEVEIYSHNDDEEDDDDEEQTDDNSTDNSSEGSVLVKDQGLMKARASAGISKIENPFFLVVISRYHLHRGQFVHIPIRFARTYIMCKAGGFFKVEASDGRQWPVRCVRSSTYCKLSGGWISFARDNSLKLGDVCTFELTDAKNHVLKVHVAKFLPKKRDLDDDAVTEISDASNDSLIDVMEIDCEDDDESQTDDDSTENSSEEHRFLEDRKVVRALASAGIPRPKNPFFHVVIRKYHLHKGNFVHVPLHFARAYIRCKAGDFLTVETSDGRQWPIRCVRSDTYCTLGRGWAAFAWDNGLKLGDVCAFELTDARKHVLKFHIGN